MCIPWAGMALDTAQGKYEKQSLPSYRGQMLSRYPTVKERSAFISNFISSMKGLKTATVGTTVLHLVRSHQDQIESHTVPVSGIEWAHRPSESHICFSD